VEEYNIYSDIAQRSQGDVYIGVVGPVRTGKSTFIKKFMDLLVIPNIENVYQAERTRDDTTFLIISSYIPLYSPVSLS
jgi:stage IV sporulation protein A